MDKSKEILLVTDRLRALCSRREYCTQDVMKKALKALEGDRHAAEQVLETLVAEKYVDDLRYAGAYCRDKASLSGWGEVKIRYMLASKGIPREIIAEALEEIDSNRAQDRLNRLLQTKYKSIKDDPQCRLKLLRYALGRGYSYDEVSSVIDRLIHNSDNL
jgi:regulatory protein